MPDHIQTRDGRDRVILEKSELNGFDKFETMEEAVSKIKNEGEDFVEYTVQPRIYLTPY